MKLTKNIFLFSALVAVSTAQNLHTARYLRSAAEPVDDVQPTQADTAAAPQTPATVTTQLLPTDVANQLPPGAIGGDVDTKDLPEGVSNQGPGEPEIGERSDTVPPTDTAGVPPEEVEPEEAPLADRAVGIPPATDEVPTDIVPPTTSNSDSTADAGPISDLDGTDTVATSGFDKDEELDCEEYEDVEDPQAETDYPKSETDYPVDLENSEDEPVSPNLGPAQPNNDGEAAQMPPIIMNGPAQPNNDGEAAQMPPNIMNEDAYGPINPGMNQAGFSPSSVPEESFGPSNPVQTEPVSPGIPQGAISEVHNKC